MRNITTSLGVSEPEQLELFSETALATLSAAVARAQIGPGWWPLVQPLWRAGVRVHECREADGELVLSVDPAGSELLEDFIPRLRKAAAQLCVACGMDSGRITQVQGALRVLCPGCAEAVAAGSSVPEVADRHFRFDGSRRPQSPTVRAGALYVPPATKAAPAALAREPIPEGGVRGAYRHIHRVISAEVHGQAAAVSAVSTLAALHVAGSTSRGARALVVGPTGVGKSTLIRALSKAIAPWALPVGLCDANALTGPGWSLAPSIGTIIKGAVGYDSLTSERAEKAVIVVDEIHHGARITPGAWSNTLAKQQEVSNSLLQLVGHGTLHIGDDGERWSSERALVICMGAMTGLDLSRPLTVRRMVRYGFPLELANRMCENVIRLEALSESQMIGLLRAWPAVVGLVQTCRAIGIDVTVLDSTYRRAALALREGAGDEWTARNAGGWISTALQEHLAAALEDESTTSILITPDCLSIPAAGSDPDEMWDSGWGQRPGGAGSGR